MLEIVLPKRGDQMNSHVEENVWVRGLGTGGNHGFFLSKPIFKIGYRIGYGTYMLLPLNLKFRHLYSRGRNECQ